MQRERRLAVAGDSAPVEVLYNRTRRRRVRTEVPGLDLAWQEPSGHPQRLFDIGLEFISRERVVTFVHGANLTGMRPVNKRCALSRHGSIRAHASSVPLLSCSAPRSVPGRSQRRGAVHGKNRFTGAVLRFRHELSQQLLSAFEEMAPQLQRDIRSDARKRHEKGAVTRAIAREVVVRSPLFARILSQFWLFDAVGQARAPAPALRNTDDEAMVFYEVRFPLKGDEARVAAVLDGIEEFEREEDGEPRWRWFAAGSPLHRAARHRRGRPVAESSDNAIGTTSLGYAETRKGTLFLSVNSRERAGRGRDLLASRLGDLVGPALIAAGCGAGAGGAVGASAG